MIYAYCRVSTQHQNEIFSSLLVLQWMKEQNLKNFTLFIMQIPVFIACKQARARIFRKAVPQHIFAENGKLLYFFFGAYRAPSVFSVEGLCFCRGGELRQNEVFLKLYRRRAVFAKS